MTTNVIALDVPIDINGVSLRVIPVRTPDQADANEAERFSRKKRDGDRLAVVRMLTPYVDKAEMQRAVAGLALFRQITGLPFSALVQLQPVDQTKLGDLVESCRHPREASRG